MCFHLRVYFWDHPCCHIYQWLVPDHLSLILLETPCGIIESQLYLKANNDMLVLVYNAFLNSLKSVLISNFLSFPEGSHGCPFLSLWAFWWVNLFIFIFSFVGVAQSTSLGLLSQFYLPNLCVFPVIGLLNFCTQRFHFNAVFVFFFFQ